MTVFRRIVLYGCESRDVNKNAIETLRRWERKIIRRILAERKALIRYIRRRNIEVRVCSLRWENYKALA